MGCDIHLHVEARQSDGSWAVLPGTVRTCSYCDGKKKIKGRNGGLVDCWFCDGRGECLQEWYSDRDYDVFAILADVRNGSGFAGVQTGEGFQPFAPPKGLPDDVSPEVRKDSDEWGPDGHSHSWHPLSVILDYPWEENMTTHYGVLSSKQYVEWVAAGRKGAPKSGWCAAVTGGGVRNISNEAMDALLADGSARPGDHTRIEWRETYAVSAEYFLRSMKELVEHAGDPAALRIVFWFDN